MQKETARVRGWAGPAGKFLIFEVTQPCFPSVQFLNAKKGVEFEVHELSIVLFCCISTFLPRLCPPVICHMIGNSVCIVGGLFNCKMLRAEFSDSMFLASYKTPKITTCCYSSKKCVCRAWYLKESARACKREREREREILGKDVQA